MDLSDLLHRSYGISTEDIRRAVNYQEKYGGRLEKILVNMGGLSEHQLVNIYSQYFELPKLDLDDIELSWIDTLPKDKVQLLLNEGWIPFTDEEGLCFVCSFPLNLKVNEVLDSESITPRIYLADESEIQRIVASFNETERSSDDISASYVDEEERLRELATEAPTINLLNSLISKALRENASDMHLEPIQGKYRARYRVDGVLHEAEVLSEKMRLPIVTRIKILAGMDIAEKRRPQDGKIETRVANQEIDIRVSTLPLNDGESVVMRFLKKDNVKYDMSVLGLASDVEAMIRRDIQTTAGVVLLTGPTGSGKTTTLYTFLNALNNDGVKIITLEDPVEYQLEGINQVQINSDIGFDFAAGLRSIVRQDPDIIMLGEIRDRETAQIALQSALTGHLVFSTVHTNDAASAYTRLLDLGVEEFLLNAALVSIVAQRLARKLCTSCAHEDENATALIQKYNLTDLAQRFGVDNISLRRSQGCQECGQSGFKGRMALTEYLSCDDKIKSLPKDTDFIGNARAHNRELKRRTLLEDGLYKAILGMTTIDEVIRVAG